MQPSAQCIQCPVHALCAVWEMDAFHSTGLAGGHACLEGGRKEGGEEWEDEFWE